MALKGRLEWLLLKVKYRINYDKVVLVLPESDEEWNYYALIHLPDYIKRKNAEKAVILLSNQKSYDAATSLFGKNFTIVNYSIIKMNRLLKYYCLYRFFDNIVFFYLNQPQDNLSEIILKQGIVSKEELICLGFYCLRNVPQIAEGYRTENYV